MAKKKVSVRKISHAGARKKGHDFERWTANEFKKVFPDAARQMEYQIEDAKGIDVKNTGDYLVQCKRGRKYGSIAKIHEVQVCPMQGGVPVLVTRGDETEAMAVLPFKEFLRLLKIEKLASK